MHLSEDTLRAYLDRQIPPDKQSALQAHLEECPRCSNRLTELEQQSARVSALLSPLQTIQVPIRPNYVLGLIKDHKKEPFMQAFLKKPAFSGLIILAVVLFSLVFSPVRALASDFLGLFRVEQVQVVTFDPAYLEQVTSGMETSRGQIEAFFQENIIETHQGSFQSVSSSEELASIAGFAPRLPDLEASTLGVEPGSDISITLDTDFINSVLVSLDLNDYQISSEFNGKHVAVHVPTAAVFTSGNCDVPADLRDPDEQSRLNCISLVQMRSPEAVIPEGLNVARLGEAMFQIIGMTRAEAAAFSQSIDWATTLVLPIPVGEGIQHQDVQVDGVKGSLISDTSSPVQTLIWSKNGMLYAMNATQPGVDIVSLANNLK